MKGRHARLHSFTTPGRHSRMTIFCSTSLKICGCIYCKFLRGQQVRPQNLKISLWRHCDVFYTILKSSIKIALILIATVARYGPAVGCIWIPHLQELRASHIWLFHSERDQFSSFPKGFYYKDAVVNLQPVVFSSIQATFPVQLVQGKSTSMRNSWSVTQFKNKNTDAIWIRFKIMTCSLFTERLYLGAAPKLPQSSEIMLSRVADFMRNLWRY